MISLHGSTCRRVYTSSGAKGVKNFYVLEVFRKSLTQQSVTGAENVDGNLTCSRRGKSVRWHRLVEGDLALIQ